MAVHRADRSVGLLVASHLDEAEAAQAAGVPVRHELHFRDRAPIACEQLAYLLLVCRERQVPDVESRSHSRLTPLAPVPRARSQVLASDPGWVETAPRQVSLRHNHASFLYERMLARTCPNSTGRVAGCQGLPPRFASYWLRSRPIPR